MYQYIMYDVVREGNHQFESVYQRLIRTMKTSDNLHEFNRIIVYVINFIFCNSHKFMRVV